MASRGKQRLTPSQRILLWHILFITPSLALALLGGMWLVWSALLCALITVVAVRRLVVQRSARIIFTRSLEPLIIIVFAVMYLGLISVNIVIPMWQQGLILIAAFMLQIRYLLQQFRVETVHVQSLFSLLLIILVNTVWALLAATNAFAGFASLILVWLMNYVIVHFWLERVGFHNSFLAAVWSLIAVEAMWLSSVALVFYTLPSTALVVARSSLFLTVIAYAWGSMLVLHSRRKLSKRLVVEYGMICAFLLLTLLVLSGF